MRARSKLDNLDWSQSNNISCVICNTQRQAMLFFLQEPMQLTIVIIANAEQYKFPYAQYR